MRYLRRSYATLSGLFYGWYLVGIASFMLMLMSATVFQGVGTFFVALERNFGWNRTTLSGAFSLSRAEGALLGPVEGFLVDRLGTRKMVVVGYLIMGLGFVFFSQIESVWQFYVAYLTISLGSGIGGWIAFVTLINNWFARRRALAMSVAVSGIQFGGFLVPMMAWGIENEGFRLTALVIGVILIVVALPASQFVRNRPEDIGTGPDGDRIPRPRATPPASAETEARQSTVSQDESAQAESADANEMTPRQALKTLAFWVIAVARLTSVVSIVSLSVHLVPKLTDSGISLITANFVVTLYTTVALFSGFVAGYLADRTSKVAVLFVCMLMQAFAMAILTFTDTLPMAWAFAVLWGAGFGGRVPLLTAIIGDFFGRKNFGSILGLNMVPSNIAMIIAPFMAGLIFDLRQSYFIPFLTFTVMAFIGAFVILLARMPGQASAASDVR
ncbi:MAG: MFS transporter [Chloroflexota bacterium]|nr:MFS transporter [Chloroflexota bacterium]MYC08031.1 MFS transporter [Chloroflexota bacterium]